MTEQLPLFPLGTVLFPGTVLPLHVFEERYRLMIARRIDADPAFGVVLTRLGREVADQPEIYSVGTAATLLHAARYTDGRYDIAVRGARRFRVLESSWDEGYLTGSIAWLDEAAPAVGIGPHHLLDRVKTEFAAYLDALEQATDTWIERTDLGNDAAILGYAISAAMPFDTAQRQRLLEADTPAARLADLHHTLRRERQLLLTTGIGGAAIDHPGSRFSTN